MSPLFTPEMLALTREAKGWTQRDLAEKTGLSQAVISKIENGSVDVNDERLAILAEALDCPVRLLCQPSPRVDNANTCLHHRRRASKLSAATTRRIEGIAHLTRVTVEGIFDGVQVQLDTDIQPAEFAALTRTASSAQQSGSHRAPAAPTEDLPTTAATNSPALFAIKGTAEDTAEDTADETADFDPRRADAAARLVRERWDLSGPVRNLMQSLEEHGVLIVHRSLGSRAQDGVSSWPADLTHPPLIVINQDLPADRARFTVAHELGHLLLHRTPSTHAEREANRFAAELLAPAALLEPELAGLTTGDFARLVRLKDQWGVSIGMLVQRARDTGAISERQFREFRVRLSRLGWDVNEPGTLPQEVPTLLNKAIDIGREVHGLSTEELADMACMTPASFERHYLGAYVRQATPRRVLNTLTHEADRS